MHQNSFYLLFFAMILLLTSCSKSEAIDIEKIVAPTPEYLPMSKLDLMDLSSFKKTDERWSVVGEVISDFNKDWDLVTKLGEGILVNHTAAESWNSRNGYLHQI